jgi:hypothetical protein
MTRRGTATSTDRPTDRPKKRPTIIPPCAALQLRACPARASSARQQPWGAPAGWLCLRRARRAAACAARSRLRACARARMRPPPATRTSTSASSPPRTKRTSRCGTGGGGSGGFVAHCAVVSALQRNPLRTVPPDAAAADALAHAARRRAVARDVQQAAGCHRPRDGAPSALRLLRLRVWRLTLVAPPGGDHRAREEPAVEGARARATVLPGGAAGAALRWLLRRGFGGAWCADAGPVCACASRDWS